MSTQRDEKSHDDSDAESDYDDPNHKLYPFGHEFTIPPVFAEGFIEIRNKIIASRGPNCFSFPNSPFRALALIHIQYLSAVSDTFPANWPETYRLMHDPHIPASQRAPKPVGQYDKGRLEYHTTMLGFYEDALKGMEKADAEFQRVKVAAAQNGLINQSIDAEWITYILDVHHMHFERNNLAKETYALQVLYMQTFGEQVEFDKEKMKAFYHARQNELRAANGQKAPEKKASFWKKVFGK
ncbi:hypothetical protein C8J57DRAFT_1283075 [Mycena rebaudengoi]|nr:hypothetical protein C8J57DRAFT_1283075 [Mycena rebaudengoi]